RIIDASSGNNGRQADCDLETAGTGDAKKCPAYASRRRDPTRGLCSRKRYAKFKQYSFFASFSKPRLTYSVAFSPSPSRKNSHANLLSSVALSSDDRFSI